MIKRLLFLFILFSNFSAWASITDLKLSTAQIFDVQWYISGGRLNASGFSYIYASVNYATQTNSAARWTAAQTADANSNGRYIGFFNSTTNPGTYGMAVFNSNGSVYKIINNTGSFRALADGAIFYNGNGMWGTLITTGQGYSLGQSGNWAVTQDNPNNSQLQAYTPPSSTPLASGQTAQPVTYTTTYSNQITSKEFGSRTITYTIPVKNVRNNSTGVTTTTPVTPATVPSGYISIVPYTGGGGWQNKTYTYTATTTGSGYLMFAFRHDINYWVIDNVSIKANNTGSNLLVNGGLDKSGMMTVNVGGTQQTVAAPTAWGLAYQTNQSATLGGGFDSGMWYDTSTGSYGAIYQNVNFTAGVTYTITFMVASDYNSNGDTIQMALYAGACDGESTACALPTSTGMTTAVKPSETYTVGCTTDCPTPPPPPAPVLCCGGSSAPFNANPSNVSKVMTFVNRTTADSQVHIEQLGTQNIVVVDQSGSKQNYVNYYGDGLSNNIDIKQQGNGSTEVNYTDLRVVGNFNTVKIEQTSTGGGKGAFVNIQNNNNSLILKQQDSGSHYAEVNLSGGNKTVDILQQGLAGQMASVTLTGPQPASLNLIQAGATQQYYSITNNCTTAGGCAPITVTQGK